MSRARFPAPFWWSWSCFWFERNPICLWDLSQATWNSQFGQDKGMRDSQPYLYYPCSVARFHVDDPLKFFAKSLSMLSAQTGNQVFCHYWQKKILPSLRNLSHDNQLKSIRRHCLVAQTWREHYQFASCPSSIDTNFGKPFAKDCGNDRIVRGGDHLVQLLVVDNAWVWNGIPDKFCHSRFFGRPWMRQRKVCCIITCSLRATLRCEGFLVLYTAGPIRVHAWCRCLPRLCIQWMTDFPILSPKILYDLFQITQGLKKKC